MILEGLLLLPLAAGVPVGVPAGTPANHEPPRLEILAAAAEVVSAARFCTLVTLDASGHPQARMMDPFPAEADFTIWMATKTSTRKVEQIENDPRTTLVCFDPETIAYVSLMGTATLVRDPAERASRFKPEWADFYEDSHRGDDYLLIRFEPYRLEMVSRTHGIAADPLALKPAVVELRPHP